MHVLSIQIMTEGRDNSPADKIGEPCLDLRPLFVFLLYCTKPISFSELSCEGTRCQSLCNNSLKGTFSLFLSRAPSFLRYWFFWSCQFGLRVNQEKEAR